MKPEKKYIPELTDLFERWTPAWEDFYRLADDEGTTWDSEGPSPFALARVYKTDDGWVSDLHEVGIEVHGENRAAADLAAYNYILDAIEVDLDNQEHDEHRDSMQPLNAVTTPGEIADEYGISDATVRQAIARDDIPARKSGGTWLITRADAEARWGKHRS